MAWYEAALLWREQRRGFEPAFLLGIGLLLWGLTLIANDDKKKKPGCVMSALGAALWFTVDRTSRPPRNAVTPHHPLLVCLGDSLTHGQCSGNFVERIAPLVKSKTKMNNMTVMNAGQNNICSWTIYRKRLEGVLKSNPDYVLVWIGTNDVRAIYSQWWSKQLQCMWNLPQPPTLQQLEVNVRGIVKKLLNHSSSIQVGLCTLPPMGEDLPDSANQLVRQANAVLVRIANTVGDRCTVVPLYDALERAILDSPLHGWKPPVDFFLPLSIVMGVLHHVFGVSWNQLSRFVGNTVLSDSLHLNETGANVVANVVTEWLLGKGTKQQGQT